MNVVGHSKLSMVTDERDNLKNIVKELKKSKNSEAGDQEASGTGTLVQVGNFFLLSQF